MRKTLFAFLIWAAPLSAQQPSTFDFSIPSIMRGPEVYGRPPERVRWSADSKWIYFNWLEPGHSFRDQPVLFRVRAVPGAKPERVSIPEQDSTGGTFNLGRLSHDKRYSAVEFNGDLYITDLTTGKSRRLTQTLAAERNPQFGVGDRALYFTRENNIYSLDLATGFVRQLSDIRPGPQPTDSAHPAANTQRGRLEEQQRDLFQVIRDQIRADSISKADSVTRAALGLSPVYLARNEILGSVSISPSGNSALISTRTNPEARRQTDIPRYVTRSGYVEEIRGRTNVGDVEPRGRVGLLSLPTGKVTWLKLRPDSASTSVSFGGDESDDRAAVAFLGWNDSGDRAAFFSYTGDNKTQTLYTIDGASAKLSTVDFLRDSAWVGGPCFACGGWYSHGQRIWYVSERDGFSHLYTSAQDGSDRHQLTQGRWEVRDVALSPDEQSFYLHTNEISPFIQHLYRMSVNGGARTQITNKAGKHTAVVSPDGKLIADVYSWVNRPPELFVAPNKPMADEAQLTTSPTADWLSFHWLVPEIVMIPASDGVNVPAHIYRPQEMGAKPNGAAVLFVHGAGYLHNVGHFWSEYPREYMFNQFLAAHGYVVLDLDYRGSDGYGRDWRTAIYRHMGGCDLQDQVDASRYLTKTYNIDPERVGLYGGSYGGFITLMALFTEPKFFGAGAALRSVTDWAHYNNGYTSNILNLPQNDTLAYRQSSPIYFAEGLEDPLLMAHGMQDTNVEFQDIVRLTQRLIELGKTRWTLAPYPVEDHGFIRPDSWTDEYRRIFDLFERYLPVGAPGR
jgi:dipeptidyl aminopeptidase/acylaminoacyl peptidase